MNLMHKLFFILFTLSVSFGVLSQDADTAQEDIKQIISAERVANDDFHTILSEMWGGFIFSDPDGKPTILSQVVGYTNVLALVLGIIIVTYVSIAAVINSAQSGEVMGRQWNSYWLPIRTSMAFGLLIPTQVGAFSLSTAQVIVLKLVIMASTSATFLWEKAVDTTLTMNQSNPSIILPYKLAYESSVSLACAVVLTKESNLGDPSVMQVTYTDNSIIDIVEGDIDKGDDGMMKHLSKKLDELKSPLSNGDGESLTALKDFKFIKQISFWSGECGKVEFAIPDFSALGLSAFTEGLKGAASDTESALSGELASSVVSTNVSTKSVISTAGQAALDLKAYQAQYINFLMKFAENVIRDDSIAGAGKALKKNNRSETDPLKFSYSVVTKDFWKKLESDLDAFSFFHNSVGESHLTVGTSQKVKARLYAYKHTINEFVRVVNKLYVRPTKDSLTTTNEQTMKLLTKGGWIYAGSFFYKISQLESLVHSSSSAMISGGSTPAQMTCGECNEGYYVNASTELLSALYKYSFLSPIDTSAITGISEGVKPTPPEAFGVSLMSMKNSNSDITESTIHSAMSGLAVKLLADLGSVSFIGNNSLGGQDLGKLTENNPFQFAANIGHGMNNLRYSLYALKFAVTTGIFMAESTERGINASAGGILGVGIVTGPIAALAKSLLTMMLELLMISLTLLTAMAWTLAYYIPMMPALLWITLVGAYLLIVIEAVVATPLAVVLMATPEGEGISGSKMQNAITLLASVYLRPSLMIVGLIAAIFVAKYSFIILNVIFWSQAESAVRSDLFGFFATFSLYIVSLHQVLSNSIKSMDSLPTAILNWIGQGANAQFGQNEVSGAGDQLQAKEQSFGSMGDGFKNAFSESNKNARHKDVISTMAGKNKGK